MREVNKAKISTKTLNQSSIWPQRYCSPEMPNLSLRSFSSIVYQHVCGKKVTVIINNVTKAAHYSCATPLHVLAEISAHLTLKRSSPRILGIRYAFVYSLVMAPRFVLRVRSRLLVLVSLNKARLSAAVSLGCLNQRRTLTPVAADLFLLQNCTLFSFQNCSFQNCTLFSFLLLHSQAISLPTSKQAAQLTLRLAFLGACIWPSCKLYR